MAVVPLAPCTILQPFKQDKSGKFPLKTAGLSDIINLDILYNTMNLRREVYQVLKLDSEYFRQQAKILPFSSVKGIS